MSCPSPGTPADDLRGTLQQALADLTGIAPWLPGATIEETERAAVILDQLSEETAEAAAMILALPSRPAEQAGHTFAAAAAMATAARCEPDFAAWLATVLRALARQPGTALGTRPPGSWDAWLLRQLIQGPLTPPATRPTCRRVAARPPPDRNACGPGYGMTP